MRGQEIVLDLIPGLDYERGGDLAAQRRDLYLSTYNTLREANLKKDTEKMRTVIRLLDRLHGAWRTVVHGDAPTRGRSTGSILAGGLAA